MKKLTLIGIGVTLLAGSAMAQTTLTPTIPGTGIRDYSQPGYEIKGREIQPTVPGTGIRDYQSGGYRIEGNEVQPTLPGTNIRDYSKPSYEIK